jgi:hypothetical protein
VGERDASRRQRECTALEAIVLDRVGARGVAPVRDRGHPRVGGSWLDMASRSRARSAASIRRTSRLLHPASGRRPAVAHDRDRNGYHPSPIDDSCRCRRRVDRPDVAPFRGARRCGPTLRIRVEGPGRSIPWISLRTHPVPAGGHMGGTTRLRPGPRSRALAHLGVAWRRHAARVRLRIAAHGGLRSGHPEEGSRRSARASAQRKIRLSANGRDGPPGSFGVRRRHRREMTDPEDSRRDIEVHGVPGERNDA